MLKEQAEVNKFSGFLKWLISNGIDILTEQLDDVTTADILMFLNDIEILVEDLRKEILDDGGLVLDLGD